jgi:hypothetical protein
LKPEILPQTKMLSSTILWKGKMGNFKKSNDHYWDKIMQEWRSIVTACQVHEDQ